jgi:hypothetical protein
MAQDSLILEGKQYISSKRAAILTGYTKDYVGQLCRGDKVDAHLIGRNWYILGEGILAHKRGEGKTKIEKPKEEEDLPAEALELTAYDSVEEKVTKDPAKGEKDEDEDEKENEEDITGDVTKGESNVIVKIRRPEQEQEARSSSINKDGLNERQQALLDELDIKYEQEDGALLPELKEKHREGANIAKAVAVDRRSGDGGSRDTASHEVIVSKEFSPTKDEKKIDISQKTDSSKTKGDRPTSSREKAHIIKLGVTVCIGALALAVLASLLLLERKIVYSDKKVTSELNVSL